ADADRPLAAVDRADAASQQKVRKIPAAQRPHRAEAIRDAHDPAGARDAEVPFVFEIPGQPGEIETDHVNHADESEHDSPRACLFEESEPFAEAELTADRGRIVAVVEVRVLLRRERDFLA